MRLCELLESSENLVFTVEAEDMVLPRRKRDAHKGDFGRCLIIGGSIGYTGAPVLSARAASRTGAGLVYVGVPRAIYEITAAKCDEEMPFPLSCDPQGRITGGAIGEISDRIKKCDALLIGPGLGQSPENVDIIKSLIRTTIAPIVLDADGINAIGGNTEILKEAAGAIVLTPHPGEFKRLLGCDIIPDDRLGAARDFAGHHNCIVVLKGHRTISAFPDGTAFINTTGGPALAKGGSGDVLAGMIASFICQKFTVKDAVINAVFIHGEAGDMCAREYGEYSTTAGDVINTLPKAMMNRMEI